MAWINQSRFKSAFAFNACQTSRRTFVLRRQTSLPKQKNFAFQDFWLVTISITETSKNFSDSIGSAGGGATDIAY